MSEIRKCPICRRDYKGVPAISRVDNKTLICPRCGTIEALDVARGNIEIRMGDEEYEDYKESILNAIEGGDE